MTDRNPSTSKAIFLHELSSTEKFGNLWDMQMAANNERARDLLDHEEMKKQITLLRGEVNGIGRRRKDDTLTTSQKFNIEYMKRSANLIWYRDHVLAPTLAAIQTLIVMALLYMAFGGKIP